MPGFKKFPGNKIPVTHIFAPPIPPLVRRKQIIPILKKSYYRIRRGSMMSLGCKVWDRCISVINVDGIAKGSRILGLGKYFNPKNRCNKGN
jgi:hypothetical protein